MGGLSEIYEYCIEAAKTSEFAQGGIVIGILTAIYQIIRPFPSLIWTRLARLFIYKTTVEQSDELYNLISRYIAEKYPKKLRDTEAYIKEIYNGPHHEEDEEAKEGIKFRHYTDFIIIFYRGRFLKIEKEREKLDHAESFSNLFLGRFRLSGFVGKAAIKHFLAEAYKLKKSSKEPFTKKYIYKEWGWDSSEMFSNKSVDNIFFPEKSSILTKIDHFESSKDFYLSRGIEWYLGILLHGKAGSGKTTFAKAVATYTNRGLYVINLATMTDAGFQKAFEEIGRNAVLLIDDVDIGIKERDESKQGVSLSTLFNCLDGNMSRSDLIVILTTNRKEKLDEALIRKGRIDIIEEVSYPDYLSVEDYVGNFFSQEKPDFKNCDFNLPMIDIQNICLNYPDLEDAVIKIKERFGE